MALIHNSRQSNYRNPYGAVPCETPVLLRCDYLKTDSAPVLNFRYEAHFLCRDFSFKASEIISGDEKFTAQYELSSSVFTEPGLYFYWFSAKNGERTKEYQITVFEKDLAVPDWFLNTIIYQIFPDRFNKADDDRAVLKPNSFMYSDWNDLPVYVKDSEHRIIKWEFFGGNLKGIQEKIPYIKILGADTVYINPVFEARSNHRYDTADYHKIDSLLGGDEAFEELVDNMKKEKVHIVLDGVFNHTGKCSKYFSNCKEPNSPYADWYTFNEDGTYDCWWGIDDLPAVNKNCKSFAEFAADSEDSVVRYWSRKGIDGWRLDVADEISDVLLQKIRSAAEKEIKEPVVIGEVWENASNKISYGQRKMYFTKPELHTHTNYVFRDSLLAFLNGTSSGYDLAEVFETIKETYPRQNFLAQVNMTGSHDVERLMTMMLNITKCDRRLARDLIKCYSLIQFTAAGVPLVYYGDETCLEGGKDPDNRRTYPWGKEDKEMIEWFSELARMRRNNSTFIYGDAQYFGESDGNIFAMIRKPAENQNGKTYVTICDRFGRGRTFIEENLCKIAEKVEILREKSYIIDREAAGYGLLASFE
ncbi:MAG: glycoside hydrolase family 13 protein [Ruminococcaceae bacterium]|nr:glycoside hydrolase family 13 protein [Oscillospiraceae bacterium]